MTTEHINQLVNLARAVRAMWGRANNRKRSITASGNCAEADAIVRLGEEVLALRAQHATLADARAEVETLRAEAALLREVIEGRTVPPTEAEEVAARSAHLAVVRLGQRWYVIDASGRPCAWPTVPGDDGGES